MVRINLVERVSSDAMGFLGVDGGYADPAHDVHSHRYELEVLGSHAITNAAKVIPYQAGQRLTSEKVMRKRLFAVDLESAVSVGIDSAEKEPTIARRVDLAPKARRRRGS